MGSGTSPQAIGITQAGDDGGLDPGGVVEVINGQILGQDWLATGLWCGRD